MWNIPQALGGTQTTADFNTGLNGIINLGCEPLIGLPPIWNQQGPGGTDPWTYAWQQWMVSTAGSRVRLYEMGNEPDNYLSMTGQQYYDTLWAPNVPALKAYARSLGLTIFIGGPAWANSTSASLTQIETWLAACKAGYIANGNNLDYLPDFVSTHTYPNTAQNDTQAHTQAAINAWGQFYVDLRAYIATTFAGITSSGYPVASQLLLVNSEYNDTIDTAWAGNTQTYTDFYFNAMFYMFRNVANLWAAVQFTIASHSGGALDLLNTDGTAKPEYTSFAASIIASTAPAVFSRTNSAAGGTSGTAITSGNTGGTSGDAFDGVNIGTGCTYAFDNTHAHSGTLSYKVAHGATSTFNYPLWSGLPAQATYWFREYYYFTAVPAVQRSMYRWIGASGTQLRGGVGINSTGHIFTYNSAGATISTMTAQVPTNAWCRVEGFCTGSATTGQLEVKLFTSPESTTAAETITSAATVNTGGTITDIWLGESGAAANVVAYWRDDMALNASAYPGPLSGAVAITATVVPGTATVRPVTVGNAVAITATVVPGTATVRPVTVSGGGAAVPSKYNYINISGAEFVPVAADSSGNATAPTFDNTKLQTKGTNYDYEPTGSITYLAGRGWKAAKIATRWERLQSTLNGTLNATQVGYLTTLLNDLNTSGMKALVDVHNYGHYYLDGSQTNPVQTTGTGYRRIIGLNVETTYAVFANFWSRMATQFGSHPAIAGGGGFALMNEPQDTGGMTMAMWQAASNAAVTAIWDVDPTINISVSGWSWGDIFQWPTDNGTTPWITDHRGPLRYEAHHYWDTTHSGDADQAYSVSLAQAVTDGFTAGSNVDALHTKTLTELHSFTNWLATNSVYGIIGEQGYTNTVAMGLTQWNALADRYMTECESLHVPIVHWSCGYMYSPGSDFLNIYQPAVDGQPLAATYGNAATIEAHPFIIT
jgi:hypothetical protein